MGSTSNPPFLNYLSSPALVLAALQQQQQRHRLLQERTRRVILEQAMSVAGLAVPSHHVKDTTRNNYPSVSSKSTKVDRGVKPPVLVNGETVPTKLNNLRLKKNTAPSSAEPIKTPEEERENEFSRVTRKLELRQAGLLSVIDEYPKEFPLTYRPNVLTDVIVGNDESLDMSHNIRFERLCACSLPSFQVAIRLRQGENVKEIVGSIIRSVTHYQGSFVRLWDGTKNCWREVCRNDAERFTLYELRRQNASFKAKTAAFKAELTAFSAADRAQQLVIGSLSPRSPFLRRVSPPDLQVPSPATLGETALRSEESSESTSEEEDVSERPMKQAKLSEGENSAMNALFLLSETAAKIDKGSR